RGRVYTNVLAGAVEPGARRLRFERCVDTGAPDEVLSPVFQHRLADVEPYTGVTAGAGELREGGNGVTANSLCNLAEIGNQPVDGTRRRVAGAVCPRDKSLGRLSCGVAALHHSHPSSGAGKLQFRSAAPREVFGHHIRRLVKRSGPSYPLPDHLRRREGSRPVGLRKAGLPGRQAEVSGLVLPRAAAGRPRSWSAVRRSPAAAGCRPPVAQRRPGFPPASLRRPHTGASSPSAPSLADPRAARRNRPAEGWGVGS